MTIWIIAWFVAGYLSAIGGMLVFKAADDTLDRWTPKELIIILLYGLFGFIGVVGAAYVVGNVLSEKLQDSWNDNNSWLNTEYRFKKDKEEK